MTNPSSMDNTAKPQPTRQQPTANYSYPYYQPSQPSYPNYASPYPGVQGAQAQVPPGQPGVSQGMLPTEESYIENILRLNRGKPATVYMTFENNREWNAKIFKGIVEAAGRDHIIISDPKTGLRFILPMVYLDYVTFEGELQYSYPFNGAGGGGLTSYPPR